MSISRTLLSLKVSRPSLFAALRTAVAVNKQRRALAKLEPHMLDDIGVSKTDAWSETKRPFWELPERHRW